MKPTARQSPVAIFGEAGVTRVVELPLERPACFIVIPHVHPGYFVRTDMSLSYWRIAMLSWVSSWVYMDVAVHFLRAAHLYDSRKMLCHAITNRAEEILQNAGYYSLLNQEKQAITLMNPIRTDKPEMIEEAPESMSYTMRRKHLLEWHLKTHPMTATSANKPEPMTKFVDWDLSSQGDIIFSSTWDKTLFIALIERCGRAQGAKHSDKRARQAKELYDAGISSISFFEDQRQWNDVILGQEERSWLGCCLGLLGDAAHNPPHQKAHNYQGYTGDSESKKFFREFAP
jgi:hypothetical protein